MNLTRILDDEILSRVEKPSRYVGTEINSVHKASALHRGEVDVRLALVFPDLYDIGLGNLGLHILYAIVNQLPWAWCERAYAPGLDMERELRERGLPIFALESKDSLDQMDGIGFTLQSELTFTNILNIIDLAGMPLRTADRTDAHPLTFAGGPAVFNPEPLAPFIDFFVIGDGEEIVTEIAQVLRKLKGKSRKAKLLALSLIEGIYVPLLYPFETLPDGRVLPKEGAPKVRKRVTRDLNGATFPTDYIVPYTAQVHDRISLEVLRGCTQGCRFCQAGMTTRPVRERSLEQIDELLTRTLDSTGYEEVSLVSLSTCDYSRVRTLVENTVETARARNVSVSLPSLRLDSFSVELADMVADTRRTGLTVAPEAASPRLRAVINKWIPDDDLLDMARGAFERKWDHVKLYFMIGLPTERDDDILAIADLARRTVEAGREVQQRLGLPTKAKANLGVSTFVPKPFTPFQWAAQIGLGETVRRQDVLAEALRDVPGVKFGRHEPEETFLEGLVSRADRRGADLIELAYRKGCRFDAWREHLRFDKWAEAIDELGYDVADALRERDVNERLPWDHIDVFVDKEWFQADWLRAMELQHAQDCRHKRCHKCGVIDEERELCASMLRKSIAGRKEERDWVRKPEPEREVPAPAQRIWLRVSRVGGARYLAHLEAMNAWIRALRRAQAPIAYTQGFHPHPRVAFSGAMPQNEQSLGEYMDVVLTERVDVAAFVQRLSTVMPVGFGVHGGAEVPLNAPSLMSVATGATFTIFFPDDDRDQLAARVAQLVAQDVIAVERSTKKARKGQARGKAARPFEVNLRPMVTHLAMRDTSEVPAVDITLVAVDGKFAKTRDFIALLTGKPASVRVLKRDSLMERDGAWVSIAEGWSLTAPREVETPFLSAAHS